MAQQHVETKEEKEKRKKRGFFIILTFFVSIALLLVSVFLNAAPTTSSNSVSSQASSASLTSSSEASSTTSESSETPSSSEVTSTSSIPASSEESSSSTSQPLDGPRLALLTNLEVIIHATKINTDEYFVWNDGTSFYASTFNGDTLLDTTLIAPVQSNFIIQENILPFNEGIVLTVVGSVSEGLLVYTTYYYTSEGLQNTLENMSILRPRGSFAIDEEGLFVNKIVNGAPELHYIEGPTFDSVKLVDLILGYEFYSDISDRNQYSQLGFIDLAGVMFFINAVDLVNNFQPVVMVFDASTNSLIYEGPIFSQTAITTLTPAGVFVQSIPEMKVTHYKTDGTQTEYLMSTAIFVEAFNGYFIDQMVPGGQRNVLFFVENNLTPITFNNVSYYIFESTIEKGLAFATISNDQASFTLHSYEAIVGLTSVDYPYAPELFNRNSIDSNGAIRYQTQDGSSNTLTHYIRYNQGWEFFEVFGDVTEFADALIFVGEDPYVIEIPEVTSSNRDSLTITVHDGAVNGNSSTPIVLENLDLLSVQIVGFVDEYMIVNLNFDTTRTSLGYVINLSTGTYEALPESIWYLAPSINETYTQHIYFNNNVISVYNGYGGVSFDVNDIANSFTSYAANVLADTHSMWLSIVENHFEDGDDAVIKLEYLNNNPNNIADLTILKGDISLGLPNLTVLATTEVADSFLNNHQLYIAETFIVGFNQFDLSLVTVFGTPQPTEVYLQDGMLILLEEDLTEVVLNLALADFVTL